MKGNVDFDLRNNLMNELHPTCIFSSNFYSVLPVSYTHLTLPTKA